MNAKVVLLSTALFLFVISIVMLVVAEHVYDAVFLWGMGLFFISLTIFITSIFWKIAGSITSFD